MYMHVSCSMHVTCMDLGHFPCMGHAQDMHITCMQLATMDCIAMAAGVGMDRVC